MRLRGWVLAAATIGPAFTTIGPGPTSIGGEVPAGVGAPTAAVWIGANLRADAACEAAGTQWKCVRPQGEPGVVAIFGATGVAFAPVTDDGVAPFTIRRGGAAVVLTAASVPPEDLHDARLSAIRPDRSAHRPRTLRFLSTPQPDVDIVSVSPTTFFVAAEDIDPDAFLEVKGPFATARVPLASILSAGDHRFDIPIDIPATMNGRVVDADGKGVEGATVDLFAPFGPKQAGAPAESLPAIEIGQARTDPGGNFGFEGLAAGPFIVAAAHSESGRSVRIADSLWESVELRLVALPRATGRVMRRQTPVAGASVRFVPDVGAFTNSTDPGQLASEPVTSDADGRFGIRLPPAMSGSLVIAAPEQTTVRVRVQKPAAGLDIPLGDIALPDLLGLTVRLLDVMPCEMSAAGPLGSLGLATVKGRQASNTYLFELPEAGEWVLNASCGGRSLALQPQVVSVAAGRPGGPAVIDVRIVR